MGYMGFGLCKEVYIRKPKTLFGKMKKIYGDHMEEFHKSNGSEKVRKNSKGLSLIKSSDIL